MSPEIKTQHSQSTIENNEKSILIKNSCATKIQAFYRGHLVRKQNNPSLSTVESNLCEKIIAGQLPPVIGANVPQASSGDTPVYFPPQAPTCILKMSGEASSKGILKDNALQRLNKMLYARTLCKKHHFTDLVIPRAAISADHSLDFRIFLHKKR